MTSLRKHVYCVSNVSGAVRHRLLNPGASKLRGECAGVTRPGDPDQFWGAVELLYLFGWISSIVALLHLNATRRSIGGRLILGIQLVALTLAAAESAMIAGL